MFSHRDTHGRTIFTKRYSRGNCLLFRSLRTKWHWSKSKWNCSTNNTNKSNCTGIRYVIFQLEETAVNICKLHDTLWARKLGVYPGGHGKLKDLILYSPFKANWVTQEAGWYSQYRQGHPRSHYPHDIVGKSAWHLYFVQHADTDITKDCEAGLQRELLF
jgi:hypothetical protein